MRSPRPRFLALTGPTASGKTDLSIALAEHLDVEIVSMDSRQVYRGMEIGTDKVGDEARAAVPHHGLDLVDPDQRYSAGRFARDVRGWIPDIEGRGRTPLLVGGTGFFLRAVMKPIFVEPPLEEARLRALRAYLRGQPPERLARWVAALDPGRAAVAVQGGRQRMSRTLEVALLSGRPLSWWHATAPAEGEPLHGFVVRLHVSREEMDRRIDARVTRMLAAGLVDEVRGLLARGYTVAEPGMSGTGYREVAAYLEGQVTLEEAADAIRRNTRKYARRQLTWFRHQLPASVLEIDAEAPLSEQVALVLEGWRAAGGAIPCHAYPNEDTA